MSVIRKVLVANRGEIALRVTRACRELGLATVAVYSTADETARHVRTADEAVCIGKPPRAGQLPNAKALIQAAKQTGADAVHPGYGFLAENAAFARRARRRASSWSARRPTRSTGWATRRVARELARAPSADVPGPTERVDGVALDAPRVGIPSCEGRGGRRRAAGSASRTGRGAARSGRRGPRARRRPRSATPRCTSRSSSSTPARRGPGARRPHGNVVHLDERECSLQRRRQKLLEEIPFARLDPEPREAMCAAAKTLAREVGYTSAGTIESLVDDSGRSPSSR